MSFGAATYVDRILKARNRLISRCRHRKYELVINLKTPTRLDSKFRRSYLRLPSEVIE